MKFYEKNRRANCDKFVPKEHGDSLCLFMILAISLNDAMLTKAK